MFDQPYVKPELNLEGFHCPHCNTYAKMMWGCIYSRAIQQDIGDLQIAHCSSCFKYSVWFEEKMIYPDYISIEQPNADLPEEVEKLYMEAAQIKDKSPRAAAALLRLAIEKLASHILAEKDKGSLNQNIGELVKVGLNKKTQQAFDIVRITGDDQIHDLGAINLDEQPDNVDILFSLINLIARELITEEKEIGILFGSLPENKVKGIEDRDKIK
jgi:hypothetical protein